MLRLEPLGPPPRDGAGAQPSAEVDKEPATQSSFLHVKEHLARVRDALEQLSVREIAEVAELIDATRLRRGSLFVFGNGGSAGTALHWCNDLSACRFRHGERLRVQCLTANVSAMTAIANDMGYEQLFVEQLRGLASSGDLVIGLSGSGDSVNCVAALEWARRNGATTIGLLGFEGGRMKRWCDHALHVRHDDYLVIEDAHSAICHAITRSLRGGPIGRGA
jgi:D-sedoheptulose 7-phosphate isomerase